MGLLSKAAKTTSYQSWTDIDGNASVLVQRRTDAGMAKNRSAVHQLAYGALDLFPFRIILLSGVTSNLAFDPAIPKASHEGDEAMKQATKHVIAAAQSRAEILKDWQDLRTHCDATAVTATAWPDTYKLIQFQRRHGGGSTVASVSVMSPRGSELSGSFGTGSPAPAAPSPQQSSQPAAASPASTASPAASASHLVPTPKYSDAVGTVPATAAAPSAPPLAAVPPASEVAAVGSPEPLVPEVPSGAERCGGVTDGQEATPAEMWLHSLGRVFDGSALLATFAAVLLLVAACLADVASLWLLLAVPLFVGSLTPADAIIATNRGRRERCAVALRHSPIFHLLMNRQRTCKAVATVVLLDAAAVSSIGVGVVDFSGHVCASLAVVIAVSALRGRFAVESREAWLKRLEQQEHQALDATRAALAATRASSTTTTVDHTTSPSPSAVSAAAPATPVPSLADHHPLEPPTASLLQPVAKLNLPSPCLETLELIKRGGWSKPAKYANGTVEVSIATVSWSKAPAAKFVLAYPGLRALSLLHALYDDPTGVKGKRSLAFQMEPLLRERRLLKRVSATEARWHAAFDSAIPGIAGRDFVNTVHPCTVLDDAQCNEYGNANMAGAVVYAANSWHGDGAPADNPPFVRAEMHRYGMLIQDWSATDGVGCNMTVVISIDPKGYIPNFAVPLVNRETAQKLRALERIVAQLQRDLGLPRILTRSMADATSDAGAVSKQVVATPPPAIAAPSTPEIARKALELLTSPDWQQKQEKGGFTWFSKPVSFCPADANKFTGFCPGVHAQSVQAVIDDDPDLVKGTQSYAYKFDELLTSRTKFGPDPSVPGARRVLIAFKSPFFGITGRDFGSRVMSYYLTDQEKKQYGIGCPGKEVYMYCATFDRDIPVSPKHVRGTQHSYAFVAAERADGSGCDVTVIAATDLGGSLPLSIVNGTAAAQLDKLVPQCKAIQDYEKANGAPKPRAVTAAAPPPTAPPAASPSQALSSSRPMQPREGPLPDPFHKAMQLWRQPGWQVKAQRETAVQRATASPYCTKDALWMTVKVEGATLEDVDTSLNDNAETLRPDRAPFVYDRLLDRKTVLCEGPDNRSFVLHSMFKSPVRLIAPRDTITLLYWREFLSAAHQKEFADLFVSGTGRVFAAAAVDSSQTKPVEGPFARGTTHIFSVVAVEQKDGVDLHIVMSFDPCGKVPAYLVNAANAEQLEKIVLMRTMMLSARDARLSA